VSGSAAAASPGPDPIGERLGVLGLKGGVPQRAAGFLELAVVDAAEVGRLESGVGDRLGDGGLGRFITGQEQDPAGLAVVLVG